MRFAYQTIIYGNQIGDLERAFAFIADSGFEGIELFQKPSELGGLSCDDLLGKLRKYGLSLIGLAGGELTERMKFLGNYKVPYLYTDKFPVAEMREAFRQGFRVALHPHAFKPIHNIDDVLHWWMEPEFNRYALSGQMLLLPDTAHSSIVGDDVVESCQRFRKELAAVHIKGWNAVFGRASHRYAQGFCPIDEDRETIERTLNALGAETWVVVEQDYSAESPEIAIRRSADTLTEWGFLEAGPRRLKPVTMPVPSLADDILNADSLAGFELNLRRRLDRISGTEPDDYYHAGLEAIRDLLGASTAVLEGRVESMVRRGATSRPEKVPRLTVLALAGELSEYGSNPLSREDPGRRSLGPEAWNGDNAAVSEWEAKAWSSAGFRWHRVIHNPFNLNQDRYELSLYSKRKDLELIRIERATEVFARFLDHKLNDACFLAERKVAMIAAKAARLDDFMAELRKQIADLCRCEQAVVFIADPSRTNLEPVGGEEALTWREDRKRPNEQVYHVDMDRNQVTVDVYRRKVYALGEGPRALRAGLSHMRLEKADVNDYVSTLAAPMIGTRGQAMGVVRCANRFSGLSEVRLFHNDDLAVLEAIVQSALPRINTLRADWYQQRLVRRVTHELKRPVMVIRACVESIEKEWRNRMYEFRPAFRDLPYPYFEDLNSWLGLMSTQLLNPDYLAVESKKVKLRIQETNFLPDVVAPIVRRMDILLDYRELPIYRKPTGSGDKAYSISQGVHSLPPLYVDRNMFQQIVFNLLDNAIKYADPETKDSFAVEIRSSSTATDYVVQVRDWGIGMDDIDHLDLLFEDGVRGVHAWKYDLNGAGFGLWIVRRLVELHHGSIQITSRRNPTEFTIKLPHFLDQPGWYEARRKDKTLQ